MKRHRTAFVAVIAASWLATIGGVLIAWWMLLDGHLGHLASGGISLAAAVAVGAFALSSTGMLRR